MRSDGEDEFQDTELFGLRIQVLKLGLRESVMAGRGREGVPSSVF